MLLSRGTYSGCNSGMSLSRRFGKRASAQCLRRKRIKLFLSVLGFAEVSSAYEFGPGRSAWRWCEKSESVCKPHLCHLFNLSRLFFFLSPTPARTQCGFQRLSVSHVSPHTQKKSLCTAMLLSAAMQYIF